MERGINEWCAYIHDWAKRQGFYEDYEQLKLLELHVKPEQVTSMFLAQRIASIHEEATELLSAVRNGDDAHEMEELADLVIRCFDYAEFRGFALEQAIAAKMAVNEQRHYRHDKKVF